MSGISRFSSHEDVEWAKGPFDDGWEARMVFKATIESGPHEDMVGRFAYRSWRAGWVDAEMTILSELEAGKEVPGEPS